MLVFCIVSEACLYESGSQLHFYVTEEEISWRVNWFLCEVRVGRKTGEAKTRVRLCAKQTSSDMNVNQK